MFDIMDLHRQISTSKEREVGNEQNSNWSSLSMDIDQIVMSAITEDTIILLNKADLLVAHTPQIIQECRATLTKHTSTSHIHVVSCQTQEGISDFFIWFQQYLSSR
jgi:hypothetical protein